MTQYIENQRKLNERRRPRSDGLRNWTGFFLPNRMCLPGIRRSGDNARRVVLLLCQHYNMLHAYKAKYCSVETSRRRKTFYLAFFGAVAKEFGVDPRSIRPFHVEWYFDGLIRRHLRQQQSVDSIKPVLDNAVANLKFFSRWIGKYGIVKDSSHYLNRVDEGLLKGRSAVFRASAVNHDKVEEILDRGLAMNAVFGVQLLLMASFGLRNKEACGIRPEYFMQAPKEEGGMMYLRIPPKSGSKGGRPRSIPISNEFQLKVRGVVDLVCATFGLAAVANPRRSLEEEVREFCRLAPQAGLQRANFGSSPYLFRHSFAQRYFASLEERLGEDADRQEAVSLSLGHYRREVTGIYLNGTVRAGKEQAKRIVGALTRLPRGHAKAQENILTLLRELYHLNPRGAFALACWLVDKERPESNYGLFGALRQLELQKHSLPDAADIIGRVAGALGAKADDVARIMSIHGDSVHPSEMEKQVLRPYISKLFSSSGKSLENDDNQLNECD